MREIKFRAKRVDNGEWVFGGYSYCEKDNTHYITVMGKDHISHIGFHQQVNPETIGQFTGLYDKNGKEIYEGDIISSNHYPFVDDNKQNYVGVIEYIPEFASFQYILNCVNPDKNGISNGINEQLEANENLILEDFEVIGNIYENKELIGE